MVKDNASLILLFLVFIINTSVTCIIIKEIIQRINLKYKWLLIISLLFTVLGSLTVVSVTGIELFYNNFIK